MAWTTLPTYVAGNALTAAQMNAIADNLDETAVAKATTVGDYFVASGTNALVKRHLSSDTLTTSATTTSTSYTTAPSGDDGPEVTVTTGTSVLIWHSLQLENSGAGSSWGSFAITGATTDAASDTRAVMNNGGAGVGSRMGVTTFLNPTAGSNVFTMAFRVSSGTGTFDDKRLHVMSMS